MDLVNGYVTAEVVIAVLLFLLQLGLPAVGIEKQFWYALAIWIAIFLLASHLLWAHLPLGPRWKVSAILAVAAVLNCFLFPRLSAIYEAQHSSPPSPISSGHKEAQGPEFRLSLLGGNIFVPDMDSQLTGIALDARMVNIGAPGIAMKWGLIVDHTEKTTAQLTKPPKALSLNGAAGPRVLYAADSLESKAMAHPLRDGDPPLEGWLLFYVKLPKSKVMGPNTVLRLTVEDSRGHQFSATQRMGDWLQR